MCSPRGSAALAEPRFDQSAKFAKLQRIKDNEEEFVPALDMLRELMEDNKAFTVNMRAAHEVASESNDSATTSLLENFIDETEKRTWFLFEASRVTNQPNN